MENKTIKITGLHCPNCAKNLENQINKLDSVKNAKLDFVKSSLCFESENTEKAIQDIIKVTKFLEPNAVISTDTADKKQKTSKKNINIIIDTICLVLGVAIACVCLFVNMSSYLFWPLFVVSLLLLGYKTYLKAVKFLFKGTIGEHLLLTISVVGACVLGEYMEASMVIALYSIGKIFENMAVDKSRKSIAKLTNLQPEYATIFENNKQIKVQPQQVEVGSIIIVKPGERVPIDGIVIKGHATLDMQSLTGESLPVDINQNQQILSGSIVLDGVLQIKTTTEYVNSTVSRILNLIENASQKKSKTETTISKISKWYTLGVIICAISVFGLVWLITKDANEAVYRGLIFLVVSCPCAFAISVPLTYFSGIGNASKHGVLVKGTNYLDILSKLKVIAFDKTGTLTTGKFEIEQIETLNQDFTQQDILYIACLGEQNSVHPIAISLLKSNNEPLTVVNNVKEVAGEGVYFEYKNDNYFVGRKNPEEKSTVVQVYKNQEIIGKIHVADQIKPTSSSACKQLSSLNIQTALLSGDNQQSVDRVIKQISISQGFANMLPQDKFDWIENKKQSVKGVAYVGDGINDAPSLMLADVGISMGINGSPASIEASDVVLVDDNPEKIVSAIKISKHTQKIVWQNIIFSAVIKIAFLTLGALGITGMLFAVFADVGVTLLAILNSMRNLVYKPNKKQSAK